MNLRFRKKEVSEEQAKYISKKGFTLIEVLVTLGLVAIITGGLLMLTTAMLKSQARSVRGGRNEATALRLDQSMLKYSSTEKYEDILNFANDFYLDTINIENSQNKEAARYFSEKLLAYKDFKDGKARVWVRYLDPDTLKESADPATDKGLKIVRSKIDWMQENPENAKSLLLETIVSEKDPADINNKLIAGYFNKGMIEYSLAQDYDLVINNPEGGFYIDTSLATPFNQAASQYFKDRLTNYKTLESVKAIVEAYDIDANTKQLISTINWTENEKQQTDKLETIMGR